MGKNALLRLCCGTAFLGIPALAGGPYGVKCDPSMCLLERSGHSRRPGTGNVQCHTQGRAELFHPDSDPNDLPRALCSQPVSHTSIKARTYVEEMQPSLPEGDLTH